MLFLKFSGSKKFVLSFLIEKENYGSFQTNDYLQYNKKILIRASWCKLKHNLLI